MRRLRAALLAGLLVSTAAQAAVAADTPYGVYLDGRPMDRRGNSALVRSGVTFVNLVRFVKAFDGLLSFERGGLVRVSLRDRTMVFTAALSTAELDGTPLHLPAAPFLIQGDLFAPLTTLAMLANASLKVDAHARRAMLTLDSGDGFPPPPSGPDEGLGTPVPYVMPEASPTPSPSPSPLPSPSPSPLPSPAPSPLPSPAPSPLPSPAPSPLPSPAPSPLPSPAPSPLPTPAPSTLPSPVASTLPAPVRSPIPTR